MSALAFHVKIAGLLFALATLLSACGGAPDLEQRLSELRARQDEGKAAETLEELTELAAAHPDHAEVNFRLGLAMISVGRLTEAVFPLHRAAETDELAVAAGIVLASALAQTQNPAEALRTADRVLEREPDNEAALLVRAAAAVEIHDGGIALESADRLIEKSPDNVTYRFVRASALAESKRLDEAEALYRELVDEDAEGDPQTKLRACQSYTRFTIDKRKDPDGAVEVVKECIASSPETPELVAGLLGLLEEIERREDVLEILEAAVEANPDAGKLREALVGQLVQLDRLDEAKQLTESWAGEADDATSWRQVATVRRRLGDLTGALEALEKAIALSATPEEELSFFRSELLIDLGRIEEAEQALSGVQSQLYRDVLDGRLAQERGDTKRALELYARASTEWPQNYGLRVLAARTAFRLGDIERAKSDLLEATRHAPKDTDAALWLAHIYYAEGHFRDCVSYANRHLRERGLTDPAAHVLSAEALAASNHMPRALEVLEELAKAHEGEFRASAWAAAARLRARADAPKALDELDKKLAAAKLDLGDPANQIALNMLFDLHLQTGRSEAAHKRIGGLLAKRPDSAHLHGLLGRAALFQGNSDEASAEFARALELEPDDGGALSGRALLYRAQGDLPQAIETMKKAAIAAPESGDYAYMAAAMTRDSGDRVAARRMFEQTLRDHPDSVGAANDLAFMLAEDNTDLPVAQKYAERAVRLKPGAETLDTLGLVKLRLGAAEEAVGVFERALARSPEYATARYHLALALIEKGEPVAARQALEAALAHSFPEQQEARNVLARIDSGEARQ